MKKFRFSHMQRVYMFVACTTSLRVTDRLTDFRLLKRDKMHRVGGRAARRICLPGLRRGGGGRQAGAAVLSCLAWRCESALTASAGSTSSIKQKYITYCIVARAGPSHGHGQHARQIGQICSVSPSLRTPVNITACLFVIFYLCDRMCTQ